MYKQKHTFQQGSWPERDNKADKSSIPCPTQPYHADGSVPNPSKRTVFVFGSNLAGIHGAGAAAAARKLFAAPMGFSSGRCGRAYAIPTKDADLHVLPLSTIQLHVRRFVEYTHTQPDLEFFVTRVGCVLAGYSDSDIAPMFLGAANCSFPLPWAKYLP